MRIAAAGAQQTYRASSNGIDDNEIKRTNVRDTCAPSGDDDNVLRAGDKIELERRRAATVVVAQSEH